MQATDKIPQDERQNANIVELQPPMRRVLGMVRERVIERRDEQTGRRCEQLQRENTPVESGELDTGTGTDSISI